MNELTPEDDADEADEIDEIDEIDEVEEIEETDEAPAIVETDHGDHIDYEFTDWSGESRSLLDSMLTTEGIQHTWQGTTLLVRPGDEAATDALIETVNQTATEGLDPDRARVVYEVGAWSAAMQTSLADALDIAEVAYEWDERGDLVVYEDDEERVEEILDAMPDPDDPDALDAEGVDVQDVLGRLWEASGTLAKSPSDRDAVLAAIEAADRIEQIALPFGFESAVWRDLVGKSLALRAALDSPDEADQMSDDDLMEGCRQLNEQLRQYV